VKIPIWYLALMTAVGLERLRELSLSRRNEMAAGGRRAASRTYPLMVTAHVGLLTLPLIEAARTRQRTPRWGWVGVLAIATALRLWTIRTLGPAWNVRAAVPAGIDPVVTGPYAFIRHPNYVAVALEFLALPLIGGARLSALLLSALNAVVLYDRIRAEERLLASSPAYRSAFAGRPRFIPRLF
jgi:methyltransferase